MRPSCFPPLCPLTSVFCSSGRAKPHARSFAPRGREALPPGTPATPWPAGALPPRLPASPHQSADPARRSPGRQLRCRRAKSASGFGSGALRAPRGFAPGHCLLMHPPKAHKTCAPTCAGLHFAALRRQSGRHAWAKPGRQWNCRHARRTSCGRRVRAKRAPRASPPHHPQTSPKRKKPPRSFFRPSSSQFCFPRPSARALLPQNRLAFNSFSTCFKTVT